jgi:hypothetical protein
VQNHDEKVTDIIRSVLPSTARCDTRATRRSIHRAARRKVNAALRAGDSDAFVDVRGAIEEMVWDRRAVDKVARLMRWALTTSAITLGFVTPSSPNGSINFGSCCRKTPSAGTRSATSPGRSSASTFSPGSFGSAPRAMSPWCARCTRRDTPAS